MPFIGNKPSAVPLTSADITDGIITSAKIADGTIVNADINASAGIVTSKLSGALGITEADQFRLTTSYSGTNDSDITTNLERNDNTAFSVLGTGMTQSSGVFTFPSTGYYYITFTIDCDIGSTDQNIYGFIQGTINNSTYITQGTCRIGDESNTHAGTATTSVIFDVTSTANCKVKFATGSVGAGTVLGSSAQNTTFMTFIRLGDT